MLKQTKHPGPLLTPFHLTAQQRSTPEKPRPNPPNPIPPPRDSSRRPPAAAILCPSPIAARPAAPAASLLHPSPIRGPCGIKTSVGRRLYPAHYPSNIQKVLTRKLQVCRAPTSGEEEMAARGQKVLATLPQLVKTLRSRSEPIPNPRWSHLPSLRRTFSLYDQINLINSVPENQLRFQSYHDTGFTINNVKYEGSLLIVENRVMTWMPKTFAEITAESLSIFQVVRPVPEILILGCGKHIQPVSPELRRFVQSTGMKLEAVDSRNAASTYNILNEEGRPVAAAIMPYGVTS